MIDLSTLSEPPSPWGKRTLVEGEIEAVRLGPRDLRFTYRNGEIWIASEDPSPEADPGILYPGDPEPDPPKGVHWMRWVVPAGESTIVLRPVFPDRLLVLEPESAFHLLPKAEAKVFVRVPLWIRVELPLLRNPRTALVLGEFPSALLSDTWWGDFMEGEPAYWIPTTARRSMRSELFAPHLAVCSLAMTNLASVDLHVEKLALRSPHLSIFSHEDGFWSDTARVSYRGDLEETEIEMTGHPPDEAKGGVLVTRPRSPSHRGLRARTFGRFLTLPGIGGVG